MALYEDLCKIDLITPARAKMDAMGFVVCRDGKIRKMLPVSFNLDTPWINPKVGVDRNCKKWHGIYRGVYGITSRNCFNCWKIVAKIANIEDLFKVLELQESWHPYPCKCGIERRPYRTQAGIYSAFWYPPMSEGLEGARAVTKKVRSKVWETLGLQTPVFLKRACTEMEDSMGPSNEWVYDPTWDLLEDLLDSVWEVEVYPYPEPTMVKVHVKRAWIDYARACGDKKAERYYDTLWSFAIGPTVTYHDGTPEIASLPGFNLIGEGEDAKEIVIAPG